MRTHWWTAAAVAAAGLVTLVSGASARADGFPGEKDIRLGDTVTARLTGAAEEAHYFWFYAPMGSVVNAGVLPVAGSGLDIRLRLVRPGGERVQVGAALSERGLRASIRGYRLPVSGWFGFEVRSAAGTGGYTLRTSARMATALRATAPDTEPGEQVWEFRAMADTVGSVRIVPRRGSAARPVITGLVAPDGSGVTIEPRLFRRTAVVDAVTLPQTGTYTLLWRNDGGRGDATLDFRFAAPAAAPVTFDAGAADGLPLGIVDSANTGVAGGSPAAGFVGSGVCGKCHDEIFRGWSQTVHNLAVRDWRRAGLTGKSFVNDINANGIDDFRDGLDLVTQSAFATYGALAPKLSFEAGATYPYKITIGAVKYDVVRTMGGNGQWKQRYLVLVNGHMYPSPVQFNDGTLVAKAYGVYDGSDWYTGSAGSWAAKYTAASQIPKEKSFEARCSGCHNTGETITRTATGDYVVGYTDFNIGCEQCHGPARDHVTNPIRNYPVVPRDFLNGTAAGVKEANEVCTKCHQRGTAKDFFPNPVTTDAKAGFPYSVAANVPHVGPAGIDLATTFDQTTTASDFWGRKTNPFAPLPGDTWVASKSHRQQGMDLQMGRHSSEFPFSATCFDCHDPHFRRLKHQIRSVVAETPADAAKVRDGEAEKVRIATRAADNTLCLSCHAGYGPFASVAKQDVAAVSAGAAPAAVVAAVVAHMKDIGMPVADSAYDPAGTQVGQCVSCHMPMLERTAVSRTDKAGFRLMDEHNHTFTTVNARASQLYKDGTLGMSNSCTVCHGTGDPVLTILNQWATADADGDTTFHSDTPQAFQNGVANANRNGGLWCVQCHTTAGFVRAQVRGEAMNAAKSNEILKDAIARDKGIACDACHGARPDGTFANGPNPLRFPKGELCGRCHNAQSVVIDDFLAYGEMVRHPQEEMMQGLAGAPVPGETYGAGGPHSRALLGDGCVSCHYETGVAGATHQFKPQLASCTPCHGSLPSFDRAGTAGEDWDGSGAVSGFQTEVTGLLDKLKAAILAYDPAVTFGASGYYERDGATDHRLTGADDKLKRAAFNWYSVQFDASRGVHNPVRVVQVLQKSYRELTGIDVSANLK